MVVYLFEQGVDSSNRTVEKGDRVATCPGGDPRSLTEDTSLYPWFSFDELPSYEEDTRLRTEDREEDDEKEYEDRLGMSSASTSKLQILWDHYIRAEPQSYEESSWLDVFLAELLAQVKEGRDVKDALSFCSTGGGGVSTLVACELLSDVHELCSKRINGDELIGLKRYLCEDRGWRCLAVLQFLGVRGLSCARELVALLVALYPVALQEDANKPASTNSSSIAEERNPYVKFYCNDDTVDTVDIVPHARRRSTKSGRNGVLHEGNVPSRRRTARGQSIGAKVPVQHRQRSFGAFEARRNTPESASSESELLTDGIDQARSLTLKIRLNPMDFEYFTSVVRSDEEQKWQAALYELPARPAKKTSKDYVDERIKQVLDARISNFEASLLIIQLLQGLRDYDTPAKQTPAVQVLKFALDTLWSLQFGIDCTGLTGTECATLKAAAARLMLTALERVLRANEPTTAVIHNGLLPMTLRLLEDACSKPMNVFSPEEGSLLQEFIFATIYGIVTFLYCLLHQQGTALEKLSDFLELFQLFTESQDGKLVERTVFAIINLPSVDPARSVIRARKVIDMIGALTSGLKSVRRDISHATNCNRAKHKSCVNNIQIHHHSDVFGAPYTQPMVGTVTKQACCISSLFMTLANLLKQSHPFATELQIRLIKVSTAAGTCCCFPPSTLMTSIVSLLLERHDPATYAPAVAFLERTFYKELAAYSESDTCSTCDRPVSFSWDFLELYADLLTLDDPKLCYTIMAHLLKIAPSSKFHIRKELLLKVLYPTFLKAKSCYTADKGNVTAKFLIQSCLSAVSCLIVNTQICEGFTEINGLEEVLALITDTAFTRSVYALLEVTVIIEIWKTSSIEANLENIEKSALKSLFDSLEKETTELLHALEDTADGSSEGKRGDLPSDQISTTEMSDQIMEDKTTEETIVENDASADQSELEGSIDTISCFPEVFDNSEVTASCPDTDNEADPSKRINLYQASAAWRAAAGVALCSPKFRTKLSLHSVSQKSLQLFKTLAVRISTDTIADSNKSAHRLFEALLTCCLTSPLCDCDVIMELGRALMEAGVKLGRGLAIIIEALLKVSMLKPAQEETVPQYTRPRLPTMTLDAMPDCAADDSSTGEYVTADDGYEADVEIPGRSPRNSSVKRSNSLGPVVEPRGHANAHPALCSLAVDLLIHFSEQGLDTERASIITAGLRKVAVTCRESASSCAALAGSGVITKILNGFKDIFTSRDTQYQDLQHAILEVFTLLATQSISPLELVTYLSLFKVDAPPLLSLLQPLYHLVLVARPQPNFILSFPVMAEAKIFSKAQSQEYKNLEKAENLVNNFRKRHFASGICSPWSVHATCLPIGPELAWPVWLQGCSVSMWLRVERGLPINGKGILINTSPMPDSDNESLSDWGILSDNWSREDQSMSDLFLGTPVVAGSTSPPTPTSIVHLMSIGFESLVFETWLDLKSDKLILRLTRPDDKTNRTISETSVTGMLPSGRWHHLSLNFKDTVLNKRSAVVEVVLWVDGWREINAQLPFDGLLVRKPGTTCVLLGQVGSSNIGAWYLGNLMVFRCPVFTKERALYLASLGPNYTNLAECILNTEKPDFAPLIASGALDGVREIRFEGGKFDTSRRKSYGGTYLRRAVETKVSDTKIDWDGVMDATNSHLGELQDNLLLSYEAQNPNIVHLYPQAIANPAAVVRNLFPGQPGFRVVSAPEHRVSQQPPLSVAPILSVRLECQQYRGLVPAAILVGGVPIFLYLFARVVELNSTEEEQALALSIVLHLIRNDSELLNQYRSEGGTSLILRILESPRCHAGRHILKAMLDAACDSSILIKDIGSGNHSVSQNCEAVITDPELIKGALTAWRTWAKHDTLNLLLQALLLLLRDQHSQREFNASQLNRVGIVDTILTLCKEHFMYEELGAVLDSTTGTAVVELIRALMGAPPEFAHLVAITDYLVLVHQASETYITHSRHNIYFLLPPIGEKKVVKVSNTVTSSSSDESIGTLENSKLSKGLTNAQIQKNRIPKRKKRRNGPPQDTSAGEDSGIAASDGSNPLSNERQPTWTDERRACQGLVCEGLLLLLRDAVRVLPDSQVGSVLKHVLRAELLLVLANNPDTRVRTALIKVVQTYLQRASDEEVNRLIKQKYFMHLANQIALYPGSEPLVVALENLALRGPTLAAMPPLMAMIAKAAATEPNVARPIVSFITDIIAKNPNALRMLLEQGLIESLVQALVGGAHKGGSTSLYRDIHVLLVAIATKLLESPGSHQMQAVLDLHLILNHMELKEKSHCTKNRTCVSIVRDAQVALFDGELDVLATKVSNQSGFRLRSTASYLASASHITSVFTTSSDQSDHGSRSSSYTSLHAPSIAILREPGKGELLDRFRIILMRAVEFITAADESPSGNELQLTKRLFSILLHGFCNPLEKKNHWSSGWSTRHSLRKYTAKIMVWLLGPHQSNNTRIFAVRSLMEEPKAREILSSLLEVHPQVEQKFTVFFWDLLQRRDEIPSADARICAELKEALSIWDLAKGIEQASPGIWNEELALLRRELMRDRDIWIDNNLPAIQRIANRFDVLAKQLTESAMTITRTVVEEQNRERKVLMERLKHSRAMEAQAIAKWRDLARRLTHERAAWYFPESYPRSWELDPTEGPARVRIRLQRCHLNIDKRFFMTEYQDKLDAVKYEAPLSYLFMTDRQDANASALIERLHTSERIRKMSQAKVVTPRAELAGEVLIGETCLYFVPDNPDVPLHTDIALGGLDLAMVGGTAWHLEDIRELHRRRYQLQERAIEIFLITGRTYLLAFNSSKERDEFVTELSACNLPRRIPGDDLNEAITLWRSGALTNWEYITCLNKLAGRSYNDLMQYPVFPFVLADYTNEKIDLNNPKIYRNFKRPMAVQDKKNEQHYINNYNYLKQALSEGLNLIALNQEPFHYGSHYSNSGTVLHFLVRLPPFTSMFLCYQDDNFDIPDRTFHALATTWRLTSCDSTTDVKELIPEFFYLPEFLLNSEGFNFGIRQNGNRVGDVELPKWCGGDARLFILAHRAALEADVVREVLPYWIDLVFGFRQTGRPAVEAINVFHPATYYGFNVEQIADPLERQAWETMVRTYGQTPAQLFKAAHPLLIQNLGNTMIHNPLPQVIEGVDGIKWGNYVGAPGNEPVLCWKHKHRAPLASLVPLMTGDVFGLPSYTTLLLGYTKEKGASMLSGTSVLGAALVSWGGTDGIARLKCKKEQPPRPLIKSSGLDPITILSSAPDCGQLWAGHLSGKITVHTYTVVTSKIDFSSAPASVLLAHRSRVTTISLSRAFSIAVTGDTSGVIVIWDLNSLTYIRSIPCDQNYPIRLLSISETLGDIAVTYETPRTSENASSGQSELKIFTINARAVGSVLSRRRITALCYSNAPEGVSVNVIATGLDNGVIRLWSSWDLRLVREIINGVKGCGPVIAIAWALDQHHLYAVTEDFTVLIWEGSKRLSNGTPKFVNLTSL